MNHYFLNESCFIYSVSDKLSLEDNLKILNIYQCFTKDSSFCRKYAIYDIVPAYNSIAFHFDYQYIYDVERAILAKIRNLNLSASIESKIHQIDVSYTGVDLHDTAEKLGLEVKEIIKRHTQVEYHIAMLGFKPYFPYLLGLDQSLSLPRLATPRNRIAAGSVAIGGSQTTIFPEQSPSGWNIIGISDFKDFAKFSPGDKIIFREK